MPLPPFGGEEQFANAAACAAVVEALAAALPVTDAALAAGIARAQLRGRLERCDVDGVEWLLDVAHNPAAAARLAASVRRLPAAARTGVVFAAMRDKDVQSMLHTLTPFCESIVCTTAPTARALSASEIAAAAGRMAARVEAIDDPAAAIARAIAIGRPVVAAGSIFLIGPLRDILR